MPLTEPLTTCAPRIVGPRNIAYRTLLAIDDGDSFLWMPAARWLARWMGWGCRSRYQLPWNREVVRCSRVLSHQAGQHIDGKGCGWDSGCAGEVQAREKGVSRG